MKKIIFIFCFIGLYNSVFSQYGDGSDGEFNGGLLTNSQYEFSKVELFSNTTMEFSGAQNKIIYVEGDFIIHQGASIIPQLISTSVPATFSISGILINLNTQTNNYGSSGGGGNGVGNNGYSGGTGGYGNSNQKDGFPGNAHPNTTIASGGVYHGGNGSSGTSHWLDPWAQSGYTNGGGGGACGYHGKNRDNLIFVVGGEIIIEGSIVGNGEDGGNGGYGGLGATPAKRGRFACCGGGGGGGAGGNGGNGSNVFFFCKAHYTFNENLVSLKGGSYGEGGIGGFGGVDGSVNGQDNLWGGKGYDGSIGYNGINGSIKFYSINESSLKISDSCSYVTHYISCPKEDYFILFNDSYVSVAIDSIVFPDNIIDLNYNDYPNTVALGPYEKKIFNITPLMDTVGTFLIPIQFYYNNTTLPFEYVIDIQSKRLSVIEDRPIRILPPINGFDTIVVQSSTIWTVSDYTNWFTVSNGHYGIENDTTIIQYQKNRTIDERYGYIILSGYLDSDTIYYIQESGLNYPDWEITYYSNNTTLYGLVEVCHEVANENDIIGAFVGDECRGIGRVIEINGQTYTSIVVQCEQQEEIVFKLWNSQYQVIYDIELIVTIDPGGILGLPPDYLFFKVNNCQYEVDFIICYGDYVYLAGSSQTETGIYIDTLASYEGYDSIVITSLVVNPVYDTVFYDSICEGEYYYAQGENQYFSGLYYDTLSTIVGCDSVIIIDLHVIPVEIIDITIQSSSIEICSGEEVIIDAIIPATGITLTYSWYLNSVLLNNNQAEYISSSLNNGDSIYCIVQTDYECVTQDTDTSNIIVFTVYDEFVSGTISQDQIICYSTVPSEIVSYALPTGGEGNYTYQWQDSVVNESWSDINGSTLINYQPNVLTDTTYFRLVSTDTCGITTSNIIEIAVYDELIAGVINQDQVICYNTSPDTLGISINTTGGEGNYTYQWQDSVANGNWLDITGATSIIYQPNALTDTTYYRLIVNDICGTVISNAVGVNVYDQLIAGSIDQDQIICYNTIPVPLNVITNTIGGEGNYIYQWQSSYDGIVFYDIASTNSLTYAPLALTSTTYYKLKIIDNCDTVYTNIITITVYDDLVASVIGNNQDICYNSVPNIITTITAASGGEGNYTYQWYDSYDAFQWYPIASANQLNYQPSYLTDTTYFKYEVTDTCGVVTSNVIRVGVYDELVAGTINQNQNICYSTIPVELLSNLLPQGGVGIYTYQWQDSIATGSWTNISGSISINYQPPTLNETTYYRLVSNDPCGTVITNIIEINVYDELLTGSIGNDQFICEDDVPGILDIINIPTGGGSSYSYQWQQSPNNNSWADITGETNTTYQSGPLTETTDFRLSITSNMGCGTVLSNEVIVTVTPQPISNAGADDTICEDAVYQLAGYAENYTSYIWSTVNGDGSYDDPTLLNPIYTPGLGDLAAGHVRLSFTVNPQAPCSYPDIDMMMLFFEKLPTSNAGSDGIICENGSYEVLNSTANNYHSLMWSGGSGVFNDPTLLKPVYTPGNSDILNGGVYLTLSAIPNYPCNLISQDSMYLEIQWLPIVNAGSDTIICESDCIDLVGIGNYSSGYEWTSSSGAGIFFNADELETKYCPADSDIANGSVVITLTADPIAPCDQTVSDSFVLSFSLLPIADAGEDTNICESTTQYSIVGAMVNNSNSQYWQTSGDGYFNDNTLLNATYFPGIQDIANGTVELMLTAEPVSPCSQPNSDIFNLNITHLPMSNAGEDGLICENQMIVINGIAENYSSILWENITGDGIFECDTCLSTSFDPGLIDIQNGEAVLTLSSYSISPCTIVHIDTVIIDLQLLPYSYAGEDDEICEDDSYTLSGTGGNYTNTYWSSMGDGSFDYNYILNATYTPGPNDILEGYADLILFAYSINPCLGEIGDTMSLSIESNPIVFAGDDGVICEGDSYMIPASGENYSTIIWSSSGDGTFNDAGLLNATYTPGANDIIYGTVELSIIAYANMPCLSDAIDSMILIIDYYPGQPMLPEGPVYVDPSVTQSSEYSILRVPNAVNYHWYLEPIAAGTISGNDTVGEASWNSPYVGPAYVYVGAISDCGEIVSEILEVGIITSIDNQSFNGLSINISPNPTNGIINISIEGQEYDINLIIFNTSGQPIHNRNLINALGGIKNYQVDLNTEPNGIYYLKFIFSDEAIYRKVIKGN